MNKLLANKLTKKQAVLSLVGIVLAIAFASIAIFNASMKNNLKNTASTSESKNQPVTPTGEQAQVSQDIANPSEEVQSQADQSKKSEVAKSGVPPKTAQPASPSKVTQPPAPSNTSQSTHSSTPLVSDMPFAISNVTLNGAQFYCSGVNSVIMQISSVTVKGLNGKPGSFVWQTEVTGSSTANAPYPYTQTVATNQIYTTLKSPMSPGFFYSAGYARDGESVRVHVTSPNDVASAWFTIPQGTEQSCK